MWIKVQDVNGVYFTPTKQKAKVYVKLTPTNGTELVAEDYINFLSTHEECEVSDLGFGIIHEADSPKGEQVELPAGVYGYTPADYSTPHKLTPMELRSDSYMDVNPTYAKIKQDLADFLDNEPIYVEAGAMYKLGFLLYGPGGTGKTSTLRHVLKTCLPGNAVVIFTPATPREDFLQKIRDTLSKRVVVFVFEELAADAYGQKLERLLQFLDGELSVNRSIVFATTNYPEKLPGNIVERTNRFDRYYKVGNPEEAERRALLNHFLKRPPTEEEVTMTKGLSSADIKEACITSKVKRQGIDDFIKSVKKHKELVKKDFGESKPIGLSSGFSIDE